MNLPTIRKLQLWTGLLTVSILILTTACQQQTRVGETTTRGSGGVNAAHQLDKPYLVLVSIDGFRWDYMDHYPTPNLDRIAAAGSKAERLLPVFPTLTFPNHYSIATGLYPAKHGLVGNNFPDPARNKWYSLGDRDAVADPQFYAGEPIWVTAETQGMVAASYFFVGTEAPITGVHPSHWRLYDGDIPGQDRVDQVLSWLTKPEESRPHLYTLYFEDVDSHSHWYGPESPENIAAIQRVDGYIGRLLDGLKKLDHGSKVNIIVLSDHGLMAYRDDPQPFILDQHVDLGNMTIIEGGSYLLLYFEHDDPERARAIVNTVNQNWRHGTAYVPGGAPEQWHLDDNPRLPDVILAPEAGYAVLSNAEKNYKISAGDHGWPPGAPGMHGFFIASGPNIKQGVTLGSAEMVDVYPLMASILGLTSAKPIDGDSGKLARPLYIEGN